MKVIMPHNAAGRRLCVYITAVRLYCFRSYTELRFEPAKGLNVIVGANAAGKTNILESVFLAALGRSHRTRRDAELINSLSDKAYAGIELVSAAGKHSIELKLFSGAPKQVFIDGQRIRRMGELMGVLNARNVFTRGSLPRQGLSRNPPPLYGHGALPASTCIFLPFAAI